MNDSLKFATRASLLVRAQSRPDHPSWEELLELYRPFITRILGHIGLRDANLEDVKQHVLLNLWTGLPLYRKTDAATKFRSWLARLIRNTAVDWFRRQKRVNLETSLEDVGHESLPSDLPDLEERVEKEWQHYVLTLALQRLQKSFSGKALTVLSLSLQNLSCEEIGARLNLRTESVYVLKARVKSRLQREIKQLRAELEHPTHAGSG